MKKLYFLFFLVFGLNAYSQNPDNIVNIPNANFKAKLLAANATNNIATTNPAVYSTFYDEWYGLGSHFVDTNGDGEIQVSEAHAIKSLKLEYSNISDLTGIEHFINLESLRINNNGLVTLDVSQNTSLISLRCEFNNLTSLNLPNSTSLIDIRCNNNGLVNLDVTPCISLQRLYCFNNSLIGDLNVTQCPDLKVLWCYYNSITSLDLSQCSSLLNLQCHNNQLTNLDLSGCPVVQTVQCYNNDLTSLNLSGCNELTYLRCHLNELTSLDVTQSPNLGFFECHTNQITSLDLSQSIALNDLRCYNNQLTSLDISSCPLLNRLHCYNNLPLTTLNLKNGYPQSQWIYLIASNLPNLQYICASEEDIPWVISAIDSEYTNYHINSYCTFTPGGTFYEITGNTNNENCGNSDISYINLNVIISDGVNFSQYIANDSGNYYIPVGTGTFSVTPTLEYPDYFTASPSSITVNFPTETSPYNQDFCIMANGIKNDLEVTVIPVSVARPGFNAEYKIIYKNKGNQVANGSLSFTFDDTVMDLVSANPVNDSSATNSLSWSYTNLNPFETREIDLVFNINSPMETPAVNGGDVLQYTATIVGATDETPNDNTFTLNQTVVNSYDPNDKTCLEGATITPSMVGQYVHYVIRFENTGTYPAENIVVKDMIDTTKFDITTLIPQRASHDFYTRINGNKVEFIFENINLPFDDANNDGYVAFKIKTKPTLVLGNTFTNSASIYFDYNFPIVTDPATTTVAALSNQDFDFGSYFTLYPNPAKDILNFEIKNEIGVKSVSVYNTLGQIVIAITNVDNLKDIDVSSLNIGSYFVKVYTDKGNAVSKFIKQ